MINYANIGLLLYNRNFKCYRYYIIDITAFLTDLSMPSIKKGPVTCVGKNEIHKNDQKIVPILQWH